MSVVRIHPFPPNLEQGATLPVSTIHVVPRFKRSYMNTNVVWVHSLTHKFLWFKYQKEAFRVVKVSEWYYPEKRTYFAWTRYIGFGYPFFFFTHDISCDSLKGAIDYIKFHEKIVDENETT